VNKCFSEAGGDGAGLPSTSKRRASVKKRMAGIVEDSSARSIALSKSCGALAYSDPLDARRVSVLLIKKSSEGCPVLLPEEQNIKTSILGDL
jgi:hypothetical protein